jgi:hypothetical protein
MTVRARLARLDWRLVFVASLALHLGALAVRRASFTRTENLAVGFTLAEKGYLGDPFLRPTGPTAHISPVYPVVVGAVQLVTRNETRTVTMLSLIGALVSACSAVMLIPLARRMHLPEGSGVLAALLWSVPLFTWIELGGEHETVFTTAAVLATLLVLFSLLDRPELSARQGGVLGGVTGAAAHFSPLLLPMVVVATTLGALARWRSLRVRPGFVVGFAAALLIVVAPYTIRNRLVMGSTFFIRDNLGLELAVSNADDAQSLAEANFIPGAAMDRHPFRSAEEDARLRAMGEVAYNRSRQREALAWIGSHPTEFMRLTAQRAGYLLFPFSRRPYQRVIAAVLTFGALVGLVLLWRSGQRVTVAIVAGAIAGYEVIYLFVQHDVRYVYPMLWVQSLVAASVPARLLGRVRDRAAVGDTSALPDGNSA